MHQCLASATLASKARGAAKCRVHFALLLGEQPGGNYVTSRTVMLIPLPLSQATTAPLGVEGLAFTAAPRSPQGLVRAVITLKFPKDLLTICGLWYLLASVPLASVSARPSPSGPALPTNNYIVACNVIQRMPPQHHSCSAAPQVFPPHLPCSLPLYPVIIVDRPGLSMATGWSLVDKDGAVSIYLSIPIWRSTNLLLDSTIATTPSWRETPEGFDENTDLVARRLVMSAMSSLRI